MHNEILLEKSVQICLILGVSWGDTKNLKRMLQRHDTKFKYKKKKKLVLRTLK